jgi:zinc transport system substrate-binding protein
MDKCLIQRNAGMIGCVAVFALSGFSFAGNFNGVSSTPFQLSANPAHAPQPATAAESLPQPNIVTDIPVIGSLVSNLLSGRGDVISLLDAQQSPHHYSMKPSAIRALSNADLVILIDRAFMPKLSIAIESVARTKPMLVISEVDSSDFTKLAVRQEHVHSNLEVKRLDSLGSQPSEEDSIDSGTQISPKANRVANLVANRSIDPHLWIDTNNLKSIVSVIAERLKTLYPTLKDDVADREAALLAELTEIYEVQRARWSENTGARFITLHDSTQYFEAQYGLESIGSVFASSHVSPGPKQVKALQQLAKNENVSCIITDPYTNPRWASMLKVDQNINVETIDILGVSSDNPTFTAVLAAIDDGFARCLNVP